MGLYTPTSPLTPVSQGQGSLSRWPLGKKGPETRLPSQVHGHLASQEEH